MKGKKRLNSLYKKWDRNPSLLGPLLSPLLLRLHLKDITERGQGSNGMTCKKYGRQVLFITVMTWKRMNKVFAQCAGTNTEGSLCPEDVYILPEFTLMPPGWEVTE